MTNTLDSILSGKGETAPAPETTETVTQETTQTEATSQPAEATEATEAEGAERGQTTVPVAALHAERQKVKRYTEEVADFRKSNEALQRQVGELLQRIPAPQQQQQPKPDFFENPDAAVLSTVAPYLERFEQVQMHNAQLIAGSVYGADKVKEAEDAFVQAVQSRALDPSDYQKVVNAPNRYAAAVEWHKRELARAEIGDDPAAFRAKVEAEILAKHGITGGNNGGAPAAPPPVMPSNIAGARNVGSRAGPAWAGPKNLQDIFKRT